MANKEMKTLTMGGNTYEIVDKATRDRVDILEDNQLIMTDNGNGEVNLTTTNISMIDGALSESSTNAIQNRAVATAINEANKSISQNKTQINELKNSTRINLLRCKLETTTKNGITCTNNGDGTYTLNGTASSNTEFYLNTFTSDGRYKMVGCPSGGGSAIYMLQFFDFDGTFSYAEYGNGNLVIEAGKTGWVRILVKSGVTVNNKVFKPMITTDLNATYDDFISFNDSLVTGINSGLKLDTVWENASPTSNFANQSISLDLNQYKYIYIQTRGYCKSAEDLLNGAPVMHFCLVGEYAMLIHPINTNICRRLTHVTTNSISFAEGYSDTTVANDCVIPLKIYGVK